MTDRQEPDRRETYEIKVKGILEKKWSGWFNGMAITFGQASDGSPLTTLTGTVADQAKLRGLLSKIWDLNLTVLSVNRIEPEGPAPHLQHGGE